MTLTTFTVAVGTFPTEIGGRFMIDPLTKIQEESKNPSRKNGKATI